MKFSIFALSAVLAVAAAADITTADTPIPTLTAEAECAKRCDVKDICCTAKCYKVPCPSDDQANDTNECVAACPQGTGSPADTLRYTDCEQSCYRSHFWGGNGPTATRSSTSSTGTGNTGAQTTGSSDNNKNSSDNNDDDNDDSFSSSGSATTSGFAQQTDNAAANVKLGASAAGLFGLVVAAFAL
ncbi:uncharacterized protein N7515_002153 [Penicillium bovifimosum]|uniref:Uncharacterized protein n=1 Tax=Penicillium bovifimosum TaxID=126998 RepID=A0A9W9HB09_9EURO|nr:uncharacterized protein N7515_002153 [Penicillium bovifimosum]KAJ5143366.1 hypothetical protein N7515_002153 [Penicillium bovifimosum]